MNVESMRGLVLLADLLEQHSIFPEEDAELQAIIETLRLASRSLDVTAGGVQYHLTVRGQAALKRLLNKRPEEGAPRALNP